MKITLIGKPRSTGTLYKTMCRGNFPRTYLISDGEKLKSDYAKQARLQWGREPIKEHGIMLDITVYVGDRRKSDWDNFHKLSMDALTGVVWEDDSLISDANVHKRYDKENPRIEVQILSANQSKNELQD
jgi:Holliday junction resolvase RusA-like endonuclease